MNVELARALRVVRICGGVRDFLLTLVVFAVSAALICLSNLSIASDPWFQQNYYVLYKSGDFGVIFREWSLFLRGTIELIVFLAGLSGLILIVNYANMSIESMKAKYNLFMAFDRNRKHYIEGNAEASLFEILFPESSSVIVLKLNDGNDFDLFELGSFSEVPATANQAIDLAIKKHPEKKRIRFLTVR